MADNAERTELEELRARVKALEADRARDNADGSLMNRLDNGEWVVSLAKWGWGIAIVAFVLLWIVDTFIFRF